MAQEKGNTSTFLRQILHCKEQEELESTVAFLTALGFLVNEESTDEYKIVLSANRELFPSGTFEVRVLISQNGENSHIAMLVPSVDTLENLKRRLGNVETFNVEMKDEVGFLVRVPCGAIFEFTAKKVGF